MRGTPAECDGCLARQVQLARWVLARRAIAACPGGDSELAFHVCGGPAGTTLEQLAAVAGSRWHIEECLQAGRNEARLASYDLVHA